MPDPPQYSPDGRFWWDGTKWNPVTGIPPPAPAKGPWWNDPNGCVGGSMLFVFVLAVIAALFVGFIWFLNGGHF
ncbi:MAG: hypothetical protein ACYDCS_09100 [Candidatus Dormibacteria bacterium]